MISFSLWIWRNTLILTMYLKIPRIGKKKKKILPVQCTRSAISKGNRCAAIVRWVYLALVSQTDMQCHTVSYQQFQLSASRESLIRRTRFCDLSTLYYRFIIHATHHKIVKFINKLYLKSYWISVTGLQI